MTRAKNIPLPSVRTVEMIDSLAENFKIKLNDFRSYVKSSHGLVNEETVLR
jgi:hypothetical protein